MKNPINPGVFIAAIVGFVVIVAAVMFWIWRAPTASVEQGGPEGSGTASSGSESKKARAAAIMAEMKASHSGPTPEERREREEWKRTHPDGP